MIDLEGDALPEGFRIARGWCRDVQPGALRAAIAWRQRSVRVFGRTVPQPRLTAWMGDGAYTYSGERHEPAPVPAIVADLLERASAETSATYNSVLANLYRDGRDSVAWHSDDEPELGVEPTIASVSVGAPRRFLIRATALPASCARSWSVDLRHGDLLVMSGRSQADYQHSLPKSARLGERINLTFRRVRVAP